MWGEKGALATTGRENPYHQSEKGDNGVEGEKTVFAKRYIRCDGESK